MVADVQGELTWSCVRKFSVVVRNSYGNANLLAPCQFVDIDDTEPRGIVYLDPNVSRFLCSGFKYTITELSYRDDWPTLVLINNEFALNRKVSSQTRSKT